MFQVNGIPIIEDELVILETLREELLKIDIDVLRNFKRSGNNIQFTCPIHNHGMERKPSCGITTSKINDIESGTVHCFSCGYTASLEKMISDCFGYLDEGNYGKRWLVNNFVTVSVSSRKNIDLDINRSIKKSVRTNFVTEEELSKYRYYHPYMYQRKLTDEIIELFDVGYDKEQKTLTFPVRDINGNTLFIARRSVLTKYFHYPEDVDKPIYGIFELPEEADEIIICESILDCLTCWVYGKYAIALNGTGSFKQYELLKKIKCRKFICALDPDKAGYIGTQKLKKYLGKTKLVTQYFLPCGKDVNDLDYVEFCNLKESF